jgi:membrane glycosyltransferase
MSPVIAGLVLAIPLGVVTSRSSGPTGLFATPEDNHPPEVVHRANELAASARIEGTGALQQLREDAELLRYHLDSLPRITLHKLGRVDVPLATARAKVEQCDTLEEASNWLDRSELRAVLSDAVLLQGVLELHCSEP